MSASKDLCLVRDVKLRSSQLGPVLVNFEHGQLKKEDVSKLTCGVYASNNLSNICTIAAVASDGDVLYQGDVPLEDRDLCRTLLAVRNKKTNKIRLIETNHVMLSPTIGSNHVDQLSSEDRKQAQYNLSHAFGSKKAKRVADQRARMEVNVDSVKDKLSSTVNDIEVKEDVLRSPEDDSFTKLLPLCNRDAVAPADVYPISGLLKTKELESLENYYTQAIDSDEFKISEKSILYQHLSQKIATGNTKLQALLLYGEALVGFCNIQRKDLKECLKKKQFLCSFSEVLQKRISKEFLSINGKSVSRPQSLFDKAVLHIIIISLHVGAFKLDLDVLARSIRDIDLNRIRMLSRAVGTVPVKAQSAAKNLVMLKVPLPSPQSMIAFSRKSRR
ncbi:DNA-directed RNA polymerase I subunit RPA49 [Frankliniella fusca]|uniref:DNA-directed RNA polymerase I subunit RPA49 n=1 Tax=Frankliniella fusca TaxID=407009 RepID=A0AAE1GUJ1_9NEOP|nr:DNA-directed RNA polymerase I subunit RPA49 [Frankliniella fusca]